MDEVGLPMSAPLLLWVILLHWATSGGFVRGGRTWQHCTGRSKGCCAGREASRQAMAMPGTTLPRGGMSPSMLHFGGVGDMAAVGCSAWGGLSLAAQPRGFSAGGLSLRVTSRRDASGTAAARTLPAPTHGGWWGHPCACSPPAWVELCALQHKHCPKVCWPWGLTHGEGKGWKEK